MARHSLVEQVRALRRLEEARASRSLTSEEAHAWTELKASLDAHLFRPDEAPDPAANRRQSPRVPVSMGVRFPDRPAFRKSYIRNLSGGGVFIETQEAIAIGTEVRVDMAFPDRVIACTCDCVWLNKARTQDFGRGVGLKFKDLSPDDAQYIQAMVFRVMEDAAISRDEPQKRKR